MISTDFVFTRFSLFFRTAILRSIPFQEDAARIERAGACPGVATVETVVVGEGVALVTGVVVLVCDKRGINRDSLQNWSHKIGLLNRKMDNRYASEAMDGTLDTCEIILPYVQLYCFHPVAISPQKSQP